MSGSSIIINNSGNIVVNTANANTASSSNTNSILDRNSDKSGLIQFNPNLVSPLPLSAIRKRKVKFTVQLNIQELLSVSYLNGVLFCKVRLCDGGNHISYSSKKEVSNSSVSWSTDPPIQFDVKTVQLYTLNPQQQNENNINSQQQPTSSVSSSCSSSSSTTSSSNANNQASVTIIGYEPCLCRISVRKELRGGKSYQKLGYVDYNLTDYILKQQQQSMLTNENNNINGNSSEFCVNRILKEYDLVSSTNLSAKKNHQRLDNSYLKIDIKIIDTLSNLKKNTNSLMNESQQTQHKQENKSCESLNNTNASSISLRPASLTVNTINSTNSGNKDASGLQMKAANQIVSTIGSQSFTFSNNKNHVPSIIHGHNRSCSNGSIKSNVSFDFLIKNRNKKFMDEMHSTSSSSSLTTLGLQQQLSTQLDRQTSSPTTTTTTTPNQHDSNQIKSDCSSVHKINKSSSASQIVASSSIDDSTSSTIPISNNNNCVNNSNSNGNGKIEPANMRIKETRFDANDIISQIELELANKMSNFSS